MTHQTGSGIEKNGMDQSQAVSTVAPRRSAGHSGHPGSPTQGRQGEEEEGEGDRTCGLGPCRPSCLQRFATVLSFTICLSVNCFSSTLLTPLFVSQVTSVERQFQMTSAQTGALLAANDVGFLLLVLVVTHFCKTSHIPRILGVASAIYALSAFGIAGLNFMRPQSLKDLSGGNLTLERDRYICRHPLLHVQSPTGPSHLTNTSDSTQYLQQEQQQPQHLLLDPGCGNTLGEDGMISSEGGDGDSSALHAVVLMGFMFALQGIAKATRIPLGFTYIDNNVPDRAKTGFYVGIVLTVMLFGPPIGFGFGGVVSTIPVDLSDTSIETSDPRWISAWWLGILVPASLCLLASVTLFFFPKTLPTSRDRDTTASRKEEACGREGRELSTRKESSVVCNGKEKPNCLQKCHQDQIFTDHYVSHKEGVVNVCYKGGDEGEGGEGDVPLCPSSGGTGLKQIDVLKAEYGAVHEASAADAVTTGPPASEDPAAKETHVNGVQGTSEKKLSSVSCEWKKDTGTGSGQEEKKKAIVVLKELPVSLCRLLSSPVYVLMVVALSIQVFALVGSGTFLIKYLQHIFDLEPRLSSYIFGACHLVFSGSGTFLGGVLTTRVVMTRRACLKFVVTAHAVSIVLVAITLAFGCDTKSIIGVNDSDVTEGDAMTQCQCDVSNYLPVCAGNQTFASPCHAGCTHTVNATHFSNCTKSPVDTVMAGVCSSGCLLHVILFLLVEVVAGFLRSANVTPMYVITMRSVAEEDKTLALGLLSFIMSLLGFIPGPIVFGAIVDSSCLVWAHGLCGTQGACAFYDVIQLRFRYLGLEIGGNMVALLFMALAFLVLLWQLRTGRTEDEAVVEDMELSMKADGDETEGVVGACEGKEKKEEEEKGEGEGKEENEEEAKGKKGEKEEEQNGDVEGKGKEENEEAKGEERGARREKYINVEMTKL